MTSFNKYDINKKDEYLQIIFETINSSAYKNAANMLIGGGEALPVKSRMSIFDELGIRNYQIFNLQQPKKLIVFAIEQSCLLSLMSNDYDFTDLPIDSILEPIHEQITDSNYIDTLLSNLTQHQVLDIRQKPCILNTNAGDLILMALEI